MAIQARSHGVVQHAGSALGDRIMASIPFKTQYSIPWQVSTTDAEYRRTRATLQKRWRRQTGWTTGCGRETLLTAADFAGECCATLLAPASHRGPSVVYCDDSGTSVTIVAPPKFLPRHCPTSYALPPSRISSILNVPPLHNFTQSPSGTTVRPKTLSSVVRDRPRWARGEHLPSFTVARM